MPNPNDLDDHNGPDEGIMGQNPDEMASLTPAGAEPSPEKFQIPPAPVFYEALATEIDGTAWPSDQAQPRPPLAQLAENLRRRSREVGESIAVPRGRHHGGQPIDERQFRLDLHDAINAAGRFLRADVRPGETFERWQLYDTDEPASDYAMAMVNEIRLAFGARPRPDSTVDLSAAGEGAATNATVLDTNVTGATLYEVRQHQYETGPSGEAQPADELKVFIARPESLPTR